MPGSLHFYRENDIISLVQGVLSRFRQLEEEKRAINRVDMRFVALYSTLEMLYGNHSLKNFFEFFIQFFRLIIFPVKSKFKGCIQCGADLGTGIS